MGATCGMGVALVAFPGWPLRAGPGMADYVLKSTEPSENHAQLPWQLAISPNSVSLNLCQKPFLTKFTSAASLLP